MARIDALSIELQTSASAKDKLAEEYGKVIENVQAITLANVLKNTDLSGNPTSGTVEAKRFANVVAQEYGTARSAKKANKIKAKPVVIAIDDNKEYIEEVEEKDLQTYGVGGLIERRTRNHQNALAVDLDKKFFEVAVDAGTKVTPTVTDIKAKVEEVIEAVETTSNDFVQGVPRNMISVIASPKTYGDLRMAINAIPNSNNLGAMANYEQGMYNNCRIYSTAFLPAGVDFVVMVDGSVAQPIMTSIYNPTKIELSDATAFGLFTYKGTKAVTEDLIKYVGTKTASL